MADTQANVERHFTGRPSSAGVIESEGGSHPFQETSCSGRFRRHLYRQSRHAPSAICHAPDAFSQSRGSCRLRCRHRTFSQAEAGCLATRRTARSSISAQQRVHRISKRDRRRRRIGYPDGTSRQYRYHRHSPYRQLPPNQDIRQTHSARARGLSLSQIERFPIYRDLLDRHSRQPRRQSSPCYDASRRDRRARARCSFGERSKQGPAIPRIRVVHLGKADARQGGRKVAEQCGVWAGHAIAQSIARRQTRRLSMITNGFTSLYDTIRCTNLDELDASDYIPHIISSLAYNLSLRFNLQSALDICDPEQ